MKESNKQFEQLNKPVNPFAWVDDCFTFFTNEDYLMLDAELKEGMIPLYTHPQIKPLSDEEITYQFQHECPRFSRLDIFKYAVKWTEERHGIK